MFFTGKKCVGNGKGWDGEEKRKSESEYAFSVIMLRSSDYLAFGAAIRFKSLVLV